jgi:D-alanyl-D-alanine carboxypeptidase (penicillin-binding protein 5/6)
MLKKRLLLLCVVATLLNNNFAYGAKNKPIALPVQTSLVIDSKTGKILHEKNSTIQIYPASLTKLMTLYLLFEAIESGKFSLNKRLYVSHNAERMPPCKLGVKKGEYITVREAIGALATKSANDASVVVAEGIAGTEARFVKIMNTRARQLGMKDTNFANASGWHNPKQKTTAKDLAKLSIAIKRDYLPYYKFLSHNSFVFRGKVVRGHNRVNERYAGSEGLKTGYTSPSGYNLITAATRKNVSLIGVVTGGRSAASRDQQMVQLLDKHFNQIQGSNTATKIAHPKSSNNKKSIAVAANSIKTKNKKKALEG